MDRRIETRVVDTGGEELGMLIQKDACEVWWITVSPQALGQEGMLKLYDGFDAGGKLQLQIELGYSHPYSFMPPIPCDQGIYITTNLGIACYTIGYRPKSYSLKE